MKFRVLCYILATSLESALKLKLAMSNSSLAKCQVHKVQQVFGVQRRIPSFFSCIHIWPVLHVEQSGTADTTLPTSTTTTTTTAAAATRIESSHHQYLQRDNTTAQTTDTGTLAQTFLPVRAYPAP